MSYPKHGIKWIVNYGDHTYGCLSLIVCIIGTIGNILNTMVFTRKRMISPINTIFVSLAIVDLVVLLAYYQRAWYFYLKSYDDYPFGYDWSEIARIMMWQSHISYVAINTSVWLTVLASTWKYEAITDPLRNRIWCNTKTACKSISFIFILCVLLQMPFIISEITKPYEGLQILCLHHTNTYFIWINSSSTWYFIYGLIYIVIFRLIPAPLLAVYSAKLIYSFSKMKKDRKKLSASANTNPIHLKSEKQLARASLTMVILSVFCFITQMPPYIGVLLLITSPHEGFTFHVWTKDFQNILLLINSAFTFFTYYLTSIQFRENFNDLFGIKMSTSNKEEPTLGNQEHMV